MRLATLKTSTLFSLLGLSTAQSQSQSQSQSTWAQTQPFAIAASTDSLLGSSSQQGLTNIVGTRTPPAASPSTTSLLLPPAVSITGAFSTTIPTELVSVSSTAGTGSAGSASASVSVSRSVSRESVSSSGTGSQTQSTGAAMPGGLSGQQKVMGVAGALAGAAGVLFV